MSKGKVLIAAPVHQVLTEGLVNEGYELVMQEKISQGIAPALIQDCVGVITSTRLLLNRELLDAAPLLQWIGRMGSGMEVIDTGYAKQRGISCFSSPEGNSNAVAEHALGMLLALNKRIVRSHNEVARGEWKREENRGYELEGKTIGIIGFGHTGRAFARKLQAFDMEIIAYDKYTKRDIPSYVTCCDTLQQIQEKADILSFHVPLQDDTLYYFDDAFVGNMKKPFILVNTSRGSVVNSKALLEGFLVGKITGACIDVWEEEPIEKMNEELKYVLAEILKIPNVIVTPHIAGYSYEALYKMSKVLLDKIVIKQ
jgi:D-3-phosphoglycerate dehydrogenase / 2-oxoglutarate reductase